jgi:nitrite reductase/ring-hydroxylating ferredoxin subunit
MSAPIHLQFTLGFYLFLMTGITRRILGLTFLSGITIALFPGLASAVPPTKCRVLGQITTYNGRLFTCIKVKSKGKSVLAWDSGKIIPASSPSATQNPTPSPSPTKTPERVVINKTEIPVAQSSEVPNNSTRSFNARNRFGNMTTYIVARHSGSIIAMDATCPHKGCIVAVESEGLLCPCHNALFDPKNGDVLRGPASYALDRLAVREIDGVIYITD